MIKKTYSIKKVVALIVLLMMILQVCTSYYAFAFEKDDDNSLSKYMISSGKVFENKDGKSNLLKDGMTISKEASLKVLYDFSILDTSSIENNTTYVVPIPNLLRVMDEKETTAIIGVDLNGNQREVGELHIESNGYVYIKFSFDKSEIKEISDSINIDCDLDINILGNSESADIVFWDGKSISINIENEKKENIESELKDNEINTLMEENMEDIITQIKVFYWDENNEEKPLTNNLMLSFGDSLKLRYEFNIDNETDVEKVKPDIEYKVPMPKYLVGGKSQSIDIPITGQTIKLGTLNIRVDGTAYVIFSKEALDNFSVISNCYLEFECKLDKNEIGKQDKIVLKIDDKTSYNIYIKENQAEKPISPKVEKKGLYNEDDGKITWTIKVSPGKPVSPAIKLIDKFSDEQVFQDGSLNINGVSVDKKDYELKQNTVDSKIENTLTYNIPEPLDEEKTIIYQTVPSDQLFQGGESDGNVSLTNQAYLYDGDGNSLANNSASVTVNKKWASKIGTYDEKNKKINWVVTINENYRNLSNVILFDQLPEGLTLDNSSIKIDGVNYTGNVNTFIGNTSIKNRFSLEIGNTNKKQKITYDTKVAESFYEENANTEFDNKAWLQADWQLDNGTSLNNFLTPQVGEGVNVDTSIIKKEGIKYDTSTQEITWRVTINKHHIDLKKATITDTIGENQEFVKPNMDGKISAIFTSVGGNTNNKEIEYLYTGSNGQEKGPIFKIGSNSDLIGTDQVQFEYNTKVTNSEDFAYNTSGKIYTNKVDMQATLSNNDIRNASSEGKQSVSSTVLSKTGNSYNYSDKNLEWSIDVNQNKMKMDNVSLEDIIPEGQRYVPATVLVNDKKVDDINVEFIEANKSLVIKLGDIQDKVNVKFKTNIDVDSKENGFDNNGVCTIKNKIKLKRDTYNDVTTEGEYKIDNSVLKKDGIYIKDLDCIDYTIKVNQNGMKLDESNNIIIDTLPSGLELDTSSVKLYEVDVNNDGTYTKGTEQTVEKSQLKYDIIKNEFKFYLPVPTNKTYQLEYRADIIDLTKKSFSNKASFMGTGTPAGSESNVGGIAIGGGGGGGVASRKGKVTLTIKDKDGKALKGAVFVISDEYGNNSKEQTTDIEGKVTFSRLSIGMNYKIMQVRAPLGYDVMSDPIDISVSSTNKDIDTVGTNVLKKGSITFQKVDDGNESVKDAEFGLYSDTGDINTITPLDKVKSDKDGLVEFSNVAVGNYRIKEISAPNDYIINEEIFNTGIDTNGVSIGLKDSKGDMHVNVVNIALKGSITINKVNKEDKNKKLEDAEFAIFNSIGVEVNKKETDTDGKLVFENLNLNEIYKIVEVNAPKGFQKSNKEEFFTLTNRDKNINFTWENSPNVADILFYKINNYGNPVANAKFGIFDVRDTEMSKVLKEIESEKDGLVKFSDVPVGRYLIKETSQPSGYNKNEQILSVEVDIDGNVTQIKDTKTGEIQTSVVNQKINSSSSGGESSESYYGSVRINSKNEFGEPLNGVTYGLYNEEERLLKENKTNENGIAVFQNLKYGKYKIKELKTISGYSTNKNIIYVEVNSINMREFNIVNYKTKEDITNKIGKIKIHNIDNSKKVIVGSEFSLFDKSQKLITKSVTDKSGRLVFENLPFETYYIQETRVPAGYKLSKDKQKIILSKAEINISIENERDRNNEPPVLKDDVALNNKLDNIHKIPKTGGILDSTIFMISGGCLLGVGLYQKKRKKK